MYGIRGVMYNWIKDYLTNRQQYVSLQDVCSSSYVIGQTIYIFILSFLLSFFSSPNLSSRRLDVCHTSTHGVALVRI